MSAIRDLPRRGVARAAWVLCTAAFCVVGGAAAGFLALVFVAVVGGELDPVVWGSGAPDAIFRRGIGDAAIVIGAAVAVGSILMGVERLAYVRQLARAAETTPQTVPAWDGRKIFTTTSPFMPIYMLGIYLLVFDVIAIIIGALALGSASGQSSIETGTVFLAAAVCIGVIMIAVLVLTAQFASPAFDRAAATIREAWGDRARRLVGAPARAASGLHLLARRGAQIGTVVGFVGGAVFFIGVATRQPCRRCEKRWYGAFGESAIDTLMIIAIPLTVIALIVIVLSLVGGWVASVIDLSALVALARSGAYAPSDGRLALALSSWWPMATAACALIAVGWGGAPLAVSAHGAAPTVMPDSIAPVLLAVGCVGLVLLWLSVASTARKRNELRDAWQLPDLVPGGPSPSKRSRARKRRR